MASHSITNVDTSQASNYQATTPTHIHFRVTPVPTGMQQLCNSISFHLPQLIQALGLGGPPFLGHRLSRTAALVVVVSFARSGATQILWAVLLGFGLVGFCRKYNKIRLVLFLHQEKKITMNNTYIQCVHFLHNTPNTITKCMARVTLSATLTREKWLMH